jgi:hypothetical protein
MDRAIRRKRTVREAILRLLCIIWDDNPDVFVLAGKIMEGFSTGTVPYTEGEITAAIVDLVDRGLAECRNIPSDGEMPEKGYRATARGRDFYGHQFPWEFIDAFDRPSRASGSNDPAGPPQEGA